MELETHIHVLLCCKQWYMKSFFGSIEKKGHEALNFSFLIKAKKAMQSKAKDPHIFP